MRAPFARPSAIRRTTSALQRPHAEKSGSGPAIPTLIVPLLNKDNLFLTNATFCGTLLLQDLSILLRGTQVIHRGIKMPLPRPTAQPGNGIENNGRTPSCGIRPPYSSIRTRSRLRGNSPAAGHFAQQQPQRLQQIDMGHHQIVTRRQEIHRRIVIGDLHVAEVKL